MTPCVFPPYIETSQKQAPHGIDLETLYIYIYVFIHFFGTIIDPHAKGVAQGLSRKMEFLNTHFEISGVPKINTRYLYDIPKTSHRSSPVL